MNRGTNIKENAKLEVEGNIFELPLLRASQGQTVIDVSPLKSSYFTYDPGFKNTAACKSEICFIDGAKGKLEYRGVDIDKLASDHDYLEVVHLLYFGNLPSKEELNAFKAKLDKNMKLSQQTLNYLATVPTGSHPMEILMGLLTTTMLKPKNNESASIDDAMIDLIAKIPVICAAIYRHGQGLKPIDPDPELSYSANFLYMCFPDAKFHLDDDFVKAMDAIFTLHAEHEQNASTTTTTTVASTDASPYASVLSGVAALSGPKHGGANEACVNMLKEIGNRENIPSFLDKVTKREAVLMGFGHRVYKSKDPRATFIQKLFKDIISKAEKDNPLFDLAQDLEKKALNDEFFKKRALFPNVDFYSGIMLSAMNFPTNFFTVLFALARTSGWLSHIKERAEVYSQPITRPRQLYVGKVADEDPEVTPDKYSHQKP